MFFLLVAALLVTTGPASAAFPDVPASHPHADAIAYVQAQGIVQGYPDGTFRPDQTINRAEFVKMLIASYFAGTTGPGPEECLQDPVIFHDVRREWFAAYVCVAKSQGIVQGYPDGTFRPSARINFSESAKILTLVFEVPLTEQGAVMPWFAGYVVALDARNAIPLSITSFDQSITRGEMAEMIWRLRAGVTNRPSRTYEELAGMERVDAWTTYRNASQKLQFSYPSTYRISTDGVFLTNADGKPWYRIGMQDTTVPEQPSLMVEVNADGYGPIFADVYYRLAEEVDGSLKIVRREEVEPHENNKDAMQLIIPLMEESRNGNTYSMQFTYAEGGKNLEPVLRQILESMRFLPAQGSSSSESDVLYRHAERNVTLRLPTGSVRRSGMETFDLPFAKGTNLQEKTLRIATGANHTSDQCFTPPFRVAHAGNVTINGVLYRKESGYDSGMSQRWDIVRYTTLYPHYSGSMCMSFTFTLHAANPDVFENPPPVFDAAGESAIFDDIMQSVTFE